MRIRMISRAGMALLFLLALWVALAAAGHASSENAVWPQSDGTAVNADGKLVIDYSHIEQGYVMARIDSPSNHRMRIRVTVGGAQLIYELNSEAEYEAFPLQMGSGKYEFSLFENVKSNKYSAEGKLTFDAQLVDENAAFLVPNPYVYYTQLSEAVAKSDELTAIFESPDKDLPQAEVYETITKFMADEFSYDFVRAASISPGELPEVDGCFEKRMGICQDLAAVMVCMLRVQGIPARLMIGYADKYYHAWTTAVVNGEEIFFDPTAAIDAIWAKKYSIERFY